MSSGEDHTALMEDLYGPLYRGEYQVGQTVQFFDIVTQRKYSATIEWVQAPHTNVEGGKHHPATYIMDQVDPTTGMPFAVAQGDVIA